MSEDNRTIQQQITDQLAEVVTRMRGTKDPSVQELTRTGVFIGRSAALIDRAIRMDSAAGLSDRPWVPVLTELRAARIAWIQQATKTDDQALLELARHSRTELSVLRAEEGDHLMRIADLCQHAEVTPIVISFLDQSSIMHLEQGLGDGCSPEAAKRAIIEAAYQSLFENHRIDLSAGVGWEAFTSSFLCLAGLLGVYPSTTRERVGRRTTSIDSCPMPLLEGVLQKLATMKALSADCLDPNDCLALRSTNFALPPTDPVAW